MAVALIRLGVKAIGKIVETAVESAQRMAGPSNVSTSFHFDASDFLRDLDRIERIVQTATVQAMEDVVNELARIASEAAPHDKGTLEKSYSTGVKEGYGNVEGYVTFSLNEDGFPVALWTHEMDYKLGPGSLAKPGTQGWSGTHYDVGNKYLERPLQGEAVAFQEYIARLVREEINRI